MKNAPAWIAKGVVTGNDFWVLPLDGSLAWQFRAPAHTIPRTSSHGVDPVNADYAGPTVMESKEVSRS